MTDEQPTDPGADPRPEAARWGGMLGAFLPLGMMFITLGLVQGLAGRGLPLFVLGVSFFTIATSGVASATRERAAGTGPAPEDAGPPAPPGSAAPLGPQPPE